MSDQDDSSSLDPSNGRAAKLRTEGSGFTLDTSGFVLATTYRSGPCAGKPQYFRCWTAIGPAATPDLAEAERFATAQAAMQSPAFTHWSSFYEPLDLSAQQREA